MTYPEKTKATAPVREIGYQLANGYYWWLYENETTPELVWPQSVYVYDQMRRTDAQVGSVLRAVTLPVLRTPWRVDPNGARPEVAEFVADNLGLPVVGRPAKPQPRVRDRFSWQEHLSEALLMLPLGYSYFEQVYRVDDDGARAHLRKLALRPAKTIQKINVAKDGGLISIEQYWAPTDTGPNEIPVDRLVAYIHAKEGGNWLGTSLLRNCYKNWLLKDRLLRVQAQTIERNGMGIPRYTAQEDATSDDMAKGLAMAKAWRSGETAGTAIPAGAALELVGVSGTLPDAEPAVRYHDEQIARAVLAHFLNLGTQTGSWALGSTFADFFTLSLQTLAQQIADVATCHVVEDLVDINFGADEPAPRIVFDEIGSRQAATAESLKSLVDAGVIRPDDALEGQARQYYGLPPADPTTVRTPPGGAAAPAPDPGVDDGVVPYGGESVAASALLGEDVDDLADAILAALEEWVDSQTIDVVAARAHDVTGELRIKGGKGGGRWTKSPVTQAILDALKDWGRGDGPDDPFQIDGKPIDREPLRKAAVARGITLKRGATREDIVAALKDDVHGEVSSAREADKARKQSAKFSITHGGKRIDVAVFTDQPTGKKAILRETDDHGRRGRVITSQSDLDGLEKWAGDNGHSDIAGWAAKERGGKPDRGGARLKTDAPPSGAKRTALQRLAESPDVGLSAELFHGKVDEKAAREVEVENKIRAAYRDAGHGPGVTSESWMSLATLRGKVGSDVSREEMDDALRRLGVTSGVQVIPWDNRKALSARDHAASVRLGGQDNHAIRFEDASPRPMPTGAPNDEIAALERQGLVEKFDADGGPRYRITPAGREAAKNGTPTARSIHDYMSGLDLYVADSSPTLRFNSELQGEPKRGRAPLPPSQVADNIDAWVHGPDGPLAKADKVRAGEEVEGVPYFPKTGDGPDKRESEERILREQAANWTEVAKRLRARREAAGGKGEGAKAPAGSFDARAASAKTGSAALTAAAPRRKLSSAQIDATDQYGIDTSYNINGALREHGGDTSKLRRPEKHGPIVESLDSAMEPLSSDIVVYRRVHGAHLFGNGEPGDQLTGDLTGRTFTDHGFVSTSTAPRSGGSMMIRILAPKGTPAISGSHLEADEIVLGRGQTYRVVADHGKPGGTIRHIDVEVVPSDAPKAPAKAAPAKKAALSAADREKRTKAMARRYASGASIQDIADEHGVSDSTVHTALTNSGVQLRPRGGSGSPAVAKVAKAKAANGGADLAARLRASIVGPQEATPEQIDQAAGAVAGLSVPQLRQMFTSMNITPLKTKGRQATRPELESALLTEAVGHGRRQGAGGVAVALDDVVQHAGAVRERPAAPSAPAAARVRGMERQDGLRRLVDDARKPGEAGDPARTTLAKLEADGSIRRDGDTWVLSTTPSTGRAAAKVAKAAPATDRRPRTADDIRDLVLAQRESGVSKNLDADLAHLDDNQLRELHDEIAKGGNLYDRSTAKKVQEVLDRRGADNPLAGLEGLTTNQKRARLRGRGLSKAEIDALVPLAGGARPKGDAVRAAFDVHELRDPDGKWTISGAVRHIADAIDSGEANSKVASGGQHGAVRFVTHKNGTRTVHKVLEDASDTVGRDIGDPVRQADAEQLGGNLGHLIGAPVPRVHRTAPDEVHMDHVEGQTVKASLDQVRKIPDIKVQQAETAALYRELAGTDEGVRLGVFDLLTGNWDRNNEANAIITPDRTPVGIDHSFLWDDVDPDPAVPPEGTWAISPFARAFVDIPSSSPDRWTVNPLTDDQKMTWKDNPLTPEDIDWLREKLAESESDFEAAGHHDWWEFASARLEAIAPHATGTRSRFAT